MTEEELLSQTGAWRTVTPELLMLAGCVMWSPKPGELDGPVAALAETLEKEVWKEIIGAAE